MSVYAVVLSKHDTLTTKYLFPMHIFNVLTGVFEVKIDWLFDIERNCGRENSFGSVGARKTVMLRVNIKVNPETEYGSFEFYDLETGGEDFYAEGGLWFNGRELIDFDGIFDLPDFIQDALSDEGFTGYWGDEE
mgnify:CR=1 FL=1